MSQDVTSVITSVNYQEWWEISRPWTSKGQEIQASFDPESDDVIYIK